MLGTYECLPIQQVLLAGGMISFDDLATRLMSIDPHRFRDVSNVEDAVNNYSICLENNGHIVTYNRNAKRYSKHGFERDVQLWLHNSVPNMEKWQLYPFKSPSNSDKCYIDISWKDIPEPNEKNIREEYRTGVNTSCDFRKEGEDGCGFGCGISHENIKKNGFRAFIGGAIWVEEDELRDHLGDEEVEERLKTCPVRYEKRENNLPFNL